MDERWRRNRKNWKTPTTVQDLPDRLLKLVLLRLDSHIYLLRAAATCKRWRRIAAGNDFVDVISFFRRHPGPHVLGHYHGVDPFHWPGRRCPVFAPISPAAVVDARHFSLDFLPRGRRSWDLVDGHGSLLLLANRRRGGLFPDLVVCEPITRRHVRIDPTEGMKYHHFLGAFLGPSSAMFGMSDFRVAVVLYERYAWAAGDVGAAATCVYDRRRGGWRNRWDRKLEITSSVAHGVHIPGVESAHFAGRAAGSVFWGIEADGTVLAASEYHGGPFRLLRLPEHVRGGSHRRSSFWFVEYRRLVRLVSLIGDELRVFLERHHKGGGGSDWEPEKSLCLSKATQGLQGYKKSFFGGAAKIVTAGTGYVLLTPAEETWLFSVELDTMTVERKHSRNRYASAVYPYELRSPPVVRTCVVPCKRRGLGRCSHICICS